MQTANLLSEHSDAIRDDNPFLLVMSVNVKLTMDCQVHQSEQDKINKKKQKFENSI